MDTITIVITATDNYYKSISDSYKFIIKYDLKGIREPSNKDDLIISSNPSTNYILVQIKNENLLSYFVFTANEIHDVLQEVF